MKKSNSIIILILIFVFSWVPVNAQDTLAPHTHYAKYAIGISPSALANIYVGFQITQDFRLKERLNFSLETAFLYFTLYNDVPTKGFRIKPGIEYSTLMSSRFAMSIGLYGLLRYVKKHDFATVNYTQGFQQKYPYINNQLLLGASIGFRFIYNFSKKVFIEYGHGFGAGQITVKRDGFVPKRVNYKRILFNNFSSPGEHFIYIVSTHFSVSYRIIE